MAFFWKKKTIQKDIVKPNINGDDICHIYYLLRDYQSNKSNNIAVIKNRKKFNWQLKVWHEKMDKKKGDQVLKRNDNYYTFIISEQEVNIIFIESLQKIEELNIKYYKYM